MSRWLVVTLIAPFASYGERAGNVERGTAERPTRSALIGLAGAALGIRRDDAEGQRQLATSFRVGILTLRTGTLLTDFHTFQSLPSSKGKPRTRGEALAVRGDLATSITRREYRTDVWHEAAYTAESGARWSLEELADAFRRPAYTLFLGRKSCPLSAPLDPVLTEAETGLFDVFTERRRSRPSFAPDRPLFDRRIRSLAAGTVAAERESDLGGSNTPARRHRRIDDPGDRLTWQFAARDEFILPWRHPDEESSP
ncbi:MAG: type I-E CRISPR-associated protein Cas5/CasD [Gammaproteobacteria bacterium]